jgi:hypothetical protein
MAMSSSFASSVSSQGEQSVTSTTPQGTPLGAQGTPSGGVTRTKSWHVPGPSTRYHKSEHARPKPVPRCSTNSQQHARNQSSTSSYTEASSTASPLTRLNFTRDPTKDYVYNPNDTIKSRNNPATPLHSPHLASNNFNNLRFQGSPFSDYFTDDARSVEHNTPYHPSDPALKLLLRLNNLGSDILRLGLQSDSVDEFSEKLCTLEAMVHDGTYSDILSVSDDRERRTSFITRTDDQAQRSDARERHLQSPEHSNKSRLSDVWMADACEYADGSTQTMDDGLAIKFTSAATQTRQDLVESGVWVNDYANVSVQTVDNGLVADLQQVVERLAKANDALRLRYDQSSDVCDSQAVQIEELTTQLMTVKSENDGLKQDLAFDHSELLFLKLQLQALEMQGQNYGREGHVLLAEDFVKWKADWDNVDARLRSRRLKNRVTFADIKDLPGLDDKSSINPVDQGNWQIETRKQTQGRVRSITLKRVDDTMPEEDDAALVDSHFDISASLVLKTVYCEQSSQTEEPSHRMQGPQIQDCVVEAKGTRTESEAKLILSATEIKSQQTEPIKQSDSVIDSEEEEEEPETSPTQSPCCDQEHLCRACGNTLDYSSEEDDEKDTKTPWRELCDGLVAFAGMQRD